MRVGWRCGRKEWRSAATTVGLAGLISAAGGPAPTGAQQTADGWNDAPTRALVALAIERRRVQLSDTGLSDYQAMAHGYLNFLAQVGPGFPDPPKLVRSDELAVEVYWHAPNLSKQRIVGRRDTLLLPADIDYYRDRFGIVQNNFPDSIRLGEGNDVRDVPHPLAPHGPDDYDYQIRDSLRIATASQVVEVYGVRIRPRVPDSARVVGTLYLERSTGALVRLAVTFTRAAILDHRIETLAVTLDNALVDRRYWLPRHQEMEVVRTTTWLDYPLRGIIRSRWQVCCYQINRPVTPVWFSGPEIVAVPAGMLTSYPWHGRVLDSIPPDVALASVADVRQVEETARELVGAAATARIRTTAVAAHGLSDFARVDRVEGLALGGGATQGLTPAWSVSARARYGLDDRQAKGEARLTWRAPGGVEVSAFGFRSYREAGDVSETSTLVNSLAAQEFGADHTDPYDARGAGAAVDLGRRLGGGVRWILVASRETQRALAVHATPASGAYGATIPALALQATRVTLAMDRGASAGPWGITWRAKGEIRGEWFTAADSVLPGGGVAVARAFADLSASRPFGADRLAVAGTLGVATANGLLPPQEYVYAGGTVSGPGYAYHSFAGRTVATARAEWQVPVPLPSVGLGRFGTTPSRGILAPFLSADYVSQAASFGDRRSGWYPAVGAGGLLLFDLLRVDVARGLRGRAGRWTLGVDVMTDLWGIL